VWLSMACEEHPGVQFQILQCRSCALRYLTPRPRISKIANYYASDYYSYVFHPMQSRRHMLKLYLWRMLRMLPPPSRPKLVHQQIRQALLALRGPVAHWTLPAPGMNACFIDLGSGAGDRLEIARDLGWQTCGVDLGVESLLTLRARGHLGIAADIQALPLGSKTCMYLNLSHTLEHVHDPVAVIEECRRVLQPGGIANIVVPNGGGWGASTYGVNYRGIDVPRHLYHFTPDTLKRTIAAGGLQVSSLNTTHNEWVLQQSRELAECGALPGKWQRYCLNQRLQGEIISAWCTS
jgi:SAM-dependent methyltransferase